ncbi:MAG TPA: hypothetical protein VH349_09395 [Ktedonobacterales bacterium]
MTMTPSSCATCGWRGVPAGAFCPSCGTQLPGPSALPKPPPANDTSHTGGRIALLALAGALLLIFLTLFVVGITLGNRDASADAPPTLGPDVPSATALLTVAPQTPSPAATPTSKSSGVAAKAGQPPLRYLLRHQRL